MDTKKEEPTKSLPLAPGYYGALNNIKPWFLASLSHLGIRKGAIPKPWQESVALESWTAIGYMLGLENSDDNPPPKVASLETNLDQTICFDTPQEETTGRFRKMHGCASDLGLLGRHDLLGCILPTDFEKAHMGQKDQKG